MYSQRVQTLLLLCLFRICASSKCVPYEDNCDQIEKPVGKEVTTQPNTEYEEKIEHWVMTEHKETTTPLSLGKLVDDKPSLPRPIKEIEVEITSTEVEMTEEEIDAFKKTEDEETVTQEEAKKPEAKSFFSGIPIAFLVFAFALVFLLVYTFKFVYRSLNRTPLPPPPPRRVGRNRRNQTMSRGNQELRNSRLQRDQDESYELTAIPLTRMGSSPYVRQSLRPEASTDFPRARPSYFNEPLRKARPSASPRKRSSSDEHSRNTNDPQVEEESFSDPQVKEESFCDSSEENPSEAKLFTNDPAKKSEILTNDLATKVEAFNNESSKEASPSPHKKMESSEKDLSSTTKTSSSDLSINYISSCTPSQETPPNTLNTVSSNETTESEKSEYSIWENADNAFV